MRAYGLPRESEHKYHDGWDAATYGLKSRFAGTCKRGTFNAGTPSKAKQATRRAWARKARAEGRQGIAEALGCMAQEVSDLARDERLAVEARLECEHEAETARVMAEIAQEDALCWALFGG